MPNRGVEQMEKALATAAGQGNLNPVEPSQIKNALGEMLGTISEGYNAQAVAKAVKTILAPDPGPMQPAKDPVDTLIGLKNAGFIKPQGDEISSGVATIVKEVISERGKEASEAREEARSATDRFLTLAMEMLKEGNGREIRALAEKLEKATQGGSKSAVEQAVEEGLAKVVAQSLVPLLQPKTAQSGLSGLLGQLEEFESLAGFFKRFFKERDDDPLMRIPEHLQNPLLGPDTVKYLLEDGITRAKMSQEERFRNKEIESRERVMATVESIAKQIAPPLTMYLQNMIAKMGGGMETAPPETAPGSGGN